MWPSHTIGRGDSWAPRSGGLACRESAGLAMPSSDGRNTGPPSFIQPRPYCVPPEPAGYLHTTLLPAVSASPHRPARVRIVGSQHKGRRARVASAVEPDLESGVPSTKKVITKSVVVAAQTAVGPACAATGRRQGRNTHRRHCDRDGLVVPGVGRFRPAWRACARSAEAESSAGSHRPVQGSVSVCRFCLLQVS